jgi:hypothetical protein
VLGACIAATTNAESVRITFSATQSVAYMTNSRAAVLSMMTAARLDSDAGDPVTSVSATNLNLLSAKDTMANLMGTERGASNGKFTMPSTLHTALSIADTAVYDVVRAHPTPCSV